MPPLDDLPAAMPRLLIVGAFPPPHRRVIGGIATSCRVLLQSSLASRSELLLMDTSQISNPPPGLAVRFVLAMRRFAQYLVQFERGRPHAVILFASPGASALDKGVMAWYARWRGTATVLLPRGEPPALAPHSAVRGWLHALCFQGASKIVCQGESWQKFATVGLGRSESDVPIVRNWTATPELLAIGRARVDRAQGPVRLLFLGWLEREKGIFDLLDACAALPSEVQFELDVVGDGHAMPDAKAQAARHGLADRARFRGWLDGALKDEALARADVLVLPSWSEGLPNAMIEAMAAKLAVVVTRVGNVPDVVADGREALLVPPRDVAALAAALQRVIRDAGLRSSLGVAAFALAEKSFGIEQAVDRLLTAVTSSMEVRPR